MSFGRFLLQSKGLFSNADSQQSQHTFAANNVSLCYDYDAQLLSMHKKIDFPTGMYGLNPAPEEEAKWFAEHAVIDKNNMLQKNILLLSRVFLNNARQQELSTHFADYPEITVIDIGCGHASFLLGLLAYLGDGRIINYVGIDSNKKNIELCRQAYACLHNDRIRIDFEMVGVNELSGYSLEKTADLVLVSSAAGYASHDLCVSVDNFLAHNGIAYFNFLFRENAVEFAGNTPEFIKRFDGILAANVKSIKESNQVRNLNKNISYPDYYYYLTEPKRCSHEHRYGRK